VQVKPAHPAYAPPRLVVPGEYPPHPQRNTGGLSPQTPKAYDSTNHDENVPQMLNDSIYRNAHMRRAAAPLIIK